ncbi:hypothetical protein LP420_07970 [Massilia sp. B-10]|nr:hypothetical protein LP420_07970 [Massilia sp. B-10]
MVRFTNNAAQQESCSVNVSVVGAASIAQIQGSGATSPLNNVAVITEGVVTHKLANGYFLQDAVGDGDPATSDALFVVSGAPVAVGDLVRVRGTVSEWRPGSAARTVTQLKDVSATTVLSSGNSVAAANIRFDASIDLAPYESMLVSISNDLTVNQTYFLGERGELTLAAGRRETPTNRYRPSTPEALALAADNARNVLVLDDSVDGVLKP